MIHTAVRRLGSATTGEATAARDRIRASGAVNTFLSRAAASQTFDLDTAPHAANPAPTHPDTRDAWLGELFALACVDRMLWDAAPSPGDSAPEPLLERAGLADALVASMHTQINAGYVYRQYAYAQELLACGAWLGLVAEGRPAYLPPAVAEVLVAYLDRPMAARDASERTVTDILGFYATLTGGRDRLLKVARKVCGSGYPRYFTPRPLPVSRQAPVLSWNEGLAARIALRLTSG